MKGEIIMLKKVTNFMSKPITWGGYFKLCGIMGALSVAVYGVMLVVYFWEDICDWFNGIIRRHSKQKVVYFEEEGTY